MTAELVKGGGGIFVVSVEGTEVARKTPQKGFPSEAEVVEAVQRAL